MLPINKCLALALFLATIIASSELKTKDKKPFDLDA